MSRTPINMADDSRILPPAEMAARLAELSVNVEADYYGNGGAVAAFEAQAAAFLGKEAAVMFPTGTLGNLLALQRLTGGAPARIAVHRHSHLFSDAGDNLSQLGGLTMVPLDGEGAGFTREHLRAEIARTQSARVASRVGAVAIESPSRRLEGRRFGPELPGVIAEAREAGLPLFLDGARMVIASAWSGQSPKEAAAPFDVVYLSLYKYLAAPFGCIIAGPAALFEDLYHDRRRFGGSLYQMWPAAVLAADALPRQDAIWRDARAAGDAVQALVAAAGLALEHPPQGTNVLIAPCPAPAARVEAIAEEHGIAILPPSGGRLLLKVNETWTTLAPEEIYDRLAPLLRAAVVG